MRILHTSDWHLGCELYGQRRAEAYDRFLAWLKKTIVTEHVDALLLAGDVFDTANPPHGAEKQYYSFLASLLGTCCKDVVVIAGNHDSPTKLEAAGELLSALNIHVIAEPNEEKLIIPVGSEVVVLAVPFLRPADFLSGVEGESQQEKTVRFSQAVKVYYQKLVDQAKGTYPGRKIIAMGHCFLSVSVVPDDIHGGAVPVGGLENLGTDIFPASVSYVALGHLHIPQKVEKEWIRYSGSPIPISFSEVGRNKEVVLLDTDTDPITIQPIPIPEFSHLEVIRETTVSAMTDRLSLLAKETEPVWVDARYTGEEPVATLTESLQDAVQGTSVSILRISDEARTRRILREQEQAQDISQLSPMDLFTLKCKEEGVTTEQMETLQPLFREIEEAVRKGGGDAHP
ncbi:MAG: exonuclease SbcCD subunit D C-terminal domain-containing protein [Sphaerochaeta sp.]|nr:exonuclease SbcCD subunit D C-terminal domain-containing protein [Sphaerochaeta sp.]